MRIGFIGLGRMGLPMSRNLARAGHELCVFDVVPDAIARAVADYGAIAANSPGEAARGAEAIFISVPGPDEDIAVMRGPHGVFANASPGALVMDTTTITVSLTRAFNLEARAQGLRFLEVPVSGAERGAIDGTLTAMVGGAPIDLEWARPLLDRLCQHIHLIGPSGAGMALKLINQAVYVGYQAVFAEGLAIGDAMGLDVAQMLEVLGSSAAGHPMMAQRYPAIVAHSDRGFGIDRGTLFLDLAADAFAQAGIPTPVLNATSASLHAAETAGLGGVDIIVGRDRYLRKAAS